MNVHLHMTSNIWEELYIRLKKSSTMLTDDVEFRD